MAQLAAVDVDVADFVTLEALAAVTGVVFGQSGDAMGLEASGQGTTAEVWDCVAQAAQHVVQRQESSAPERDDGGLLGCGEHGALGVSWVPWRRQWLRRACAISGWFGVDAVLCGKGAGRRCDAWSSARTLGVVRALP